ncbi:MAG: glycosyltransferase family 4 protein, partial [Novosphingobium sp.]|nr:glycosyltransferase family 4 protein [Novosphingobium sp.]
MSKLRVLSLATLYPNDLAPNFGVFVERQMQAVMKRGDVELVQVNPIGLPPFPLSLHPRYRGLGDLPQAEERGGVTVLRPHFRLLPGIGGRFNARSVARAVLPLARKLHAEAPFDLIDAQFFYPDGPAAVQVAQALGLPSSIKARGA